MSRAHDYRNRRLCYANDCHATVSPNLLMCRRHWFMVPARLRAQVWALYREGVSNGNHPTREYVVVINQARDAVAREEAPVFGKVVE